MEHHYYDETTLGRALLALERQYEMSSSQFYAAHEGGESLPAISGFTRHVWAGFYRDYLRLSCGGDLAGQAERVLSLA